MSKKGYPQYTLQDRLDMLKVYDEWFWTATIKSAEMCVLLDQSPDFIDLLKTQSELAKLISDLREMWSVRYEQLKAKYEKKIGK